MALDPSKWTHKTSEAVQTAMELATSRSHPNLTPDHLLLALLGQSDGLVLPAAAAGWCCAAFVAQQDRGSPWQTA